MWLMKNNKQILEQIRVAINKAPSHGLMQPPARMNAWGAEWVG